MKVTLWAWRLKPECLYTNLFYQYLILWHNETIYENKIQVVITRYLYFRCSTSIAMYILTLVESSRTVIWNITNDTLAQASLVYHWGISKVDRGIACIAFLRITVRKGSLEWNMVNVDISLFLLIFGPCIPPLDTTSLVMSCADSPSYSGPDYRMGLLDLGSGALDKILWISDWNSNKMKIILYKNGKNCTKECFPQYIKSSQMTHYLITLIYMFT